MVGHMETYQSDILIRFHFIVLVINECKMQSGICSIEKKRDKFITNFFLKRLLFLILVNH